MLLSFVIPTYNRAKKVKRSIDSVLSQITRPGLVEIVIVDDGSTDGTEASLRPYIKKGEIRYIRHSQNKGVAGAKNTGILNSKAEYVVLLDSDDLLEKNGLKYLLNFVQKNDYDMIFLGSKIIHTGELMYDPAFVGLKSYKDLLISSVGEYLPVCKTSVIQQNLLKNLRGYESLTWLSIAKQGYSVYYDPSPVRLYDDGGNDRLSNRVGIIKNSRKMRDGYAVYLKEYGRDLMKFNFRQFLSVNFKLVCYSLMVVLSFRSN